MKRAFLLLALAAAASPAAAAPRTETAILAGGCYWGMEDVFEHVKGVKDVVSGFAGGAAGPDRTTPAEAVKITYDPALVAYSDLLRIYFTVAHDPTQLNRQGPDVGPNYRSAIFPQDAVQRAAAEKAIGALRRAGKPVVTRIETGAFRLAPDAHQDFWRKHPTYAYILVNDVPKVQALKRVFPASYRD